MTRKRRLLSLLMLVLAVIAVLPLLIWLAAPQLLAWQLRAQLAPLGCELRSVSGLQRGWQHWQLQRLDLQCQSASGRADITIEHLQLALQFAQQRVSRIDIATLRIDAQLTPDDSTSQWPQWQWPQLPLDQLAIQTLDLQVQHPAATVDWQGRAQIDLRQPEHFYLSLTDHSHSLNAELRAPAILQARLQRGADALATLNLDATFAGAHNALHGEITVLPGLLRDARVQDWLNAQLKEQIQKQLAAQPALQAWQSDSLVTTLDTLKLKFSAAFSAEVDVPQQLDSQLQISGLKIDAGSWQAGLDLALQVSDTDTEQSLQIDALQLRVQDREGKQRLLAGLAAGTDTSAGEPSQANPLTQTEAGYFRIQRDGRDAQATLRSEGALHLALRDAAYGDLQLQVLGYTQQGDLLAPQSREAQLHVLAQGAAPLQIAGSALHTPTLRGTLRVRNQGQDWQLATTDALRFSSGRMLYPAVGKAADRWTLAALDAALRTQIQLREQAGEWQLQHAQVSADSGTLQIRHGTYGTLASKTLQLTAAGSLQQLDWQLALHDWSVITGEHDLRSASLTLDGRAQLAAAPVAIAAISPADADLSARLQLSPLRLKGFEQWPQPEIAAQFQLHKRQLVADGKVQAAGRTLFPFRARHHLGTGHGQADIALDAAAQEWWLALTPRPRALQALDVSGGQLTGTLHAQWQPGQPVRLQADHRLRDGALQLEAARATGLNWQAELRSGGDAANPLQLQAQLDLAEMVFAAGFSARKLHGDLQLDGDTLHIGNSALDLFDGQLRIPASTLDLRAPERLLHLGVLQLDLAQILALVAVDGLSGDGRLDGVLPVVHDAAGIGVRDGVLQSTQPGLLRYNPAQLPMADNIGLQALRNFHYDELVADVQYQADGRYLIGLKLKGRNPDLYNGFPISFRLNLNGQLPGLFRAALLSGDFNQHVLDQLRDTDLHAPATPATENPARR